MICKKELKSFNSVAQHVSKVHSITSEQYYRGFLMQRSDEDICNDKHCAKKTPYININVGYQKYCSSKCSNKGNNNPMYGRTGKDSPLYGRKRPEHAVWMQKHNPFRGRKHTVQTIELIQKQKQGHQQWTPNAKRKLIASVSGAKHWNWQGGITPVHMQERNSPEYKVWRTAVFRRDKHTCQICGKKGVYMHAHHIKSFSKFPELRFTLENGMTLCRKCHADVHGKKRI